MSKRRQLYMLSGHPHPLFACNTQWKYIGGFTPPPKCVRKGTKRQQSDQMGQNIKN